MSTVSEIEETASVAVTQVAKGLPWLEQIVAAYFPQGPMFALAMKIIGEGLLPGLAGTLHNLSIVNAGGKLSADNLPGALSAMNEAAIQLAQHNSGDFPNLSLASLNGEAPKGKP